MSIKLRIAASICIFTSIFLLLMGVTVYYFTSLDRRLSFEKRLLSRAVSTAHVYADSIEKKNTILQKIDSAAVASLFAKSVTIINDYDSVLYQYSMLENDELHLSSKILDRARAKESYYFKTGNKEAVAINYHDAVNRFIVAIAATDQDGRELLDGLKKIMITVLVVGVLISFFLGYFFARQLLRPIARITAQVNLISHHNLSHRIESYGHGKKDELAQLAATFNHLLDRLQESFTIQRRFISNASHELSTPLTSVSSQLEVAMQKERTVDEYKQVMASVYEDVQQMQQLTRSLLEIARTGTKGSIDLSEVRIDEVILRVVANVEKQNPQYQVEPDFGDFPDDDDSMLVFGNPDLLYTALKNIIENGCKYADDQKAAVQLSFNNDNVILEIANKGDVIAESDIQNIFHPFFRTDKAQSKPGFGLGLTLARRIIQLHKGEIEVVSDLERGTLFTITLPSVARTRALQ